MLKRKKKSLVKSNPGGIIGAKLEVHFVKILKINEPLQQIESPRAYLTRNQQLWVVKSFWGFKIFDIKFSCGCWKAAKCYKTLLRCWKIFYIMKSTWEYLDRWIGKDQDSSEEKFWMEYFSAKL